MAATEEESRRLAEELINATSALSQFTGAMIGQTEEQLKAAKAEKDAREASAAFAAKMKAAEDAAKALIGVFVNYNKEVYKGGSANKAAAASIESMGEAAKYAGAFLALLAPGGILVKGLVAGIGLLTSELIKSGKLIAEQTDEIYKAYQDMAKAGAAGAGGMQDVFDSLQKVGLGTEKFAAYLKLVNENANDLATFGNTVNKGRKIFENTMAAMSREQRVQMEQMGLDREAQAEATMGYIKQQRLLTQGTKAQMDTSSAAVMKYIQETDTLTRITGLNRKEQEKLLDDAMRNEAYNATMQEIRETQGEEGVKRVKEAAAMAMKAGPETFKQFQASLSGFVGSSNEAQQAFMASGGKMFEFTEQLRDGQIKNTRDTAVAMNDVFRATGETAKQFRGQAKMMNYGKTFGSFYEAVKAGAISVEDLAKAYDEAEAERKKQLADPTTKKAAEAENNIRDAQIIQQKTVNLAMDTYIDTSHKASEANLKLARAALAAAEALTKKTEGSQDRAITGKKLAVAASAAAAANEVKSGRIGPEEARATLENGSERDIAALGGREYLEKIAASAPAAAAPAQESTGLPNPVTHPKEYKKAITERLKKQHGGAAAPAAPAAAPAAPAAAPAAGGGATAGPATSGANPTDARLAAGTQAAPTGGANAQMPPEGAAAPKTPAPGAGARSSAARPAGALMSGSGQVVTDSSGQPVMAGGTKPQGGDFVPGGQAGAGKMIPVDPREIMAFQQSKGLVPDGVVGPQTRQAFLKAGYKEQNVQSNLQGIADAMAKIGIKDPNYIKALLGNVMKESGGRVVNEDIMGWANSDNARIRQYFGSRVAHLSDEQLDKIKANKEQFVQTFSEMIYGGSTELGRKMENTEPGDGYKFRGRGYIQLTGRKNYRDASKDLYGDDRLVKNPELVNDPSVAAPVVAWYMKRGKDRMQAALGMGSGSLSAEQARILTTSQIAGSDIRNKTVGTEILGKVASHQEGMGQYVHAAAGGVFNGPRSGYPATLHGNEAVVPLASGAIPVKFDRSFLADIMSLREQLTVKPVESAETMQNASTFSASTDFNNLVNIMQQTQSISQTMVAAMSEMVKEQRATNDITKKMLSYAQN